MKQIIQERVASLRALLEKNKLSAFIIPSADPHLSEYTASHWKSREWISGFSGSAGTAVVTLGKAGLWTDSRYFLQASQQLEGTGIDLFKDGLPGTPSIVEWLCSELSEGDTVGIDGKMFPVREVEEMKGLFQEKGIGLNAGLDPMADLWKDRPSIPQAPAFVYETKYAGTPCLEKIEKIRKQLAKNGAEGLLVSALDEIAWTLNLRGSDVKCSPVVVSYLVIAKDEIVYFIAPGKVTKEVENYLQSLHIVIKDYTEINAYLSALPIKSIQLCSGGTNYSTFSAINPSCKIVRNPSPVSLLKAVKDEQEIKGVHASQQRDGVALVKFFIWLEGVVGSGKETEISIDKKLYEFRAAQDLFMGESFETIAGYKEHGAIVHYSASPETSSTLKPSGLFLLDSGAQYLDGTTDITRTIALGKLTEEEKRDYTLVLKGHIAIATCKFPYGTRGAQLDALARMPLWKAGMNYLHGTGHGVGHFLFVHEGPQNIRLNENPTLLVPGMLTSNEPGVYKGGRHGIRIENLVLVVKDTENEFGEFYKFETVTLCPIDKACIVKSMLSPEEVEWLNDYHRMVYDKLSPSLDEEERAWLKEKTSAI